MTPETAEYLFDLNSNSEVLKYTGETQFINIAEARSFLQAYDQYEKYKMGRLHVFLKDTHRYLGFCGLKSHKDNSVDLGFRFNQESWGSGYAYESSLAHIEYAKDVLKLTELVANFMPGNTASQKLLQKLGFKPFSHKKEGDINWVIYKLDLL